MNNIIEFQNVSFRYDSDTETPLPRVIEHLDFSVRRGEFVAVLGHNGSGKSTLAKLCNAILLPEEGHVLVDGMDTADEAMKYEIRQTVGMVFQNPDNQIVATIVEEDVAFGPENLGVDPREIRQRVDDALRSVEMYDFREKEPHRLSGGQKQRVAIAGIIAMQPDCIVLDEPTAMLDPRGRKGLMRVCRSLHERGMTIVMITHFMEEAAEADRVVVLDRGTVALSGPPQEVLVRTDILSDLNLEVPFACSLSLKLRDAGLDVPVRVREEQLIEALPRALASGSAAPATVAGNATDADTTASAANAANEADEPAIELRGVSFTYNPPSKRTRAKKEGSKTGKQAKWGNDPDAVWALRDIDFSVRKGEFFGIAGHTGSGKSTLIQHTNGILRPTEGRVLVEGRDVSDKKQAAGIRADVGVVFQYPENQLFADTVYNDVAFGPRNLKLSDEEVDARVRESLALVRLDFDELRDSSPFALSGGQQRRVAFAGVLAMRPSILVLDEPTAGLDHRLAARFLGTIEKLNQRGVTIVMISHDMRAVYRYCTHVLELEDGKVVQYGPIDRSEAAQKQSRTIRKPRKSNGPVSATHVLLKVTKHEEGRH